MEYRPLGKTGLKVSALSFGASSLGGVFHSVVREDCIKTVHTALDLGVNFIDVSPYYGLTKAETMLGYALAGIPRDRYILATKVGRYGESQFDFSARRVCASVDESLARLGCGHIDLIQCHDIEFVRLDQIIQETLPALEKLRQSGKVRFVGITGLPLKIFTQVLKSAPIDTILSYCRYTLFDTSLLRIVPELEKKGVGIMSAAPISMGLLSRRPAPSWHPAPPAIREACARAAAFCQSRGVDIAKLAIQFAVAEKRIATTIVGTANPENFRNNARWVAEPLDQTLLQQVQDLLKPIHNHTWPSGLPENND
jgi:aryl-alcohol dehydrogenase-like predicted oxidoreductase